MFTNIPIDIYHSVEVFGDGSGDGGPAPASGCTHLHGVGTSIFRIQHPSTYGDNSVDAGATHPGVGRAKLHGFMLTNDAPTDRTKHGIIHRGIADIYDVYGRGLGGLVIRGWAGNHRGVSYRGNISTSSYARIKGEGCQGTWSIGGSEASVIQTDGCQGYQNRQFSMEDHNGAGTNEHRGIHETYCGLVPPVAGPFVACSDSGNLYVPNLGCVDFADEAATNTLLNAHAPSGTAAHNPYWVYAGPGGVTAQTPAHASGGPWVYGGGNLCMTPYDTKWRTYKEGGGLPDQSFYRHPEWEGGTIDRSQLFGGTLHKSTDDGMELIRSGACYSIMRSGGGGWNLSFKDYDDFVWWFLSMTAGGQALYQTTSTHKFQVLSGGTPINVGDFAYAGLSLDAGKKFSINGVDVLSGQIAAIADLAGGADAATIVAKVNALLAGMRGTDLLDT